MEDRLVKVSEAAATLGLGRTTTWQLISTGELQVVRVGRAVRVPTAELQRFIAARTAPSRDQLP